MMKIRNFIRALLIIFRLVTGSIFYGLIFQLNVCIPVSIWRKDSRHFHTCKGRGKEKTSKMFSASRLSTKSLKKTFGSQQARMITQLCRKVFLSLCFNLLLLYMLKLTFLTVKTERRVLQHLIFCPFLFLTNHGCKLLWLHVYHLIFWRNNNCAKFCNIRNVIG
jgi:hypothetical protein